MKILKVTGEVVVSIGLLLAALHGLIWGMNGLYDFLWRINQCR